MIVLCSVTLNFAKTKLVLADVTSDPFHALFAPSFPLRSTQLSLFILYVHIPYFFFTNIYIFFLVGCLRTIFTFLILWVTVLYLLGILLGPPSKTKM